MNELAFKKNKWKICLYCIFTNLSIIDNFYFNTSDCDIIK